MKHYIESLASDLHSVSIVCVLIFIFMVWLSLVSPFVLKLVALRSVLLYSLQRYRHQFTIQDGEEKVFIDYTSCVWYMRLKNVGIKIQDRSLGKRYNTNRIKIDTIRIRIKIDNKVTYFDGMGCDTTNQWRRGHDGEIGGTLRLVCHSWRARRL